MTRHRAYPDPFTTSAFYLEPRFAGWDREGEQHPITTLRILLAQGKTLSAPRHESSQLKRWDHVLQCLGNQTTMVLVLDRLTGSCFPAEIPGPGELSAHLSHTLLEQLAYGEGTYDKVILPIDDMSRLSGDLLLFHEATGLSSCQDYCVLGTWCINCQNLAYTTANLCHACTQELEDEADELKEDGLKRYAGIIPLGSPSPPINAHLRAKLTGFRQDALEASYDL